MPRQTGVSPYADPLNRRIAAPLIPPGMASLPFNPNAGEGATGSDLKNIQPQPLVDMRSMQQIGSSPTTVDGQPTPSTPTTPIPAPPDQSNTRDAIGRALIAFSHGMAATPAGAAYSPLGGAIAGGLAGAGQSYQDALNRRMAMYQQQYGPLIAARAAGLKTAAEKEAADPYEAAAQGRMLDRQTQDIKLRAGLNLAAQKELVGATTKGMKVSDVDALTKRAQQDVIMAPNSPEIGSDEYNNAIQNRLVQLVQQAKSMGVQGLTAPSTPAATAAPAAGSRPPLTSFFH